MAYVRKKGRFFYLVQSIRRGNRVRQKTVAYLGKSTSLDEALAITTKKLDSAREWKQTTGDKITALESDPAESRLRRTKFTGVYVRDWKWVKLKQLRQRQASLIRKITKLEKRIALLTAVSLPAQ